MTGSHQRTRLRIWLTALTAPDAFRTFTGFSILCPHRTAVEAAQKYASAPVHITIGIRPCQNGFPELQTGIKQGDAGEGTSITPMLSTALRFVRYNKRNGMAIYARILRREILLLGTHKNNNKKTAGNPSPRQYTQYTSFSGWGRNVILVRVSDLTLPPEGITVTDSLGFSPNSTCLPDAN